MDGLSFTASTTAGSIPGGRTRLGSFRLAARRGLIGSLPLPCRSKFLFFASQEEAKHGKWDPRTLNFGGSLGGDSKLSLTKIMGRKANSDASNFEMNDSFYEKKGKLSDGDMKEGPFDKSGNGQSLSSLDGLNLVRPARKKELKYQADDKPVAPEIKKYTHSAGKSEEKAKATIPNVILRKPTLFFEDDITENPTRMTIKPNLNLKMRDKRANHGFSEMTLLRKPKHLSIKTNEEKKQEFPVNSERKAVDETAAKVRREEAEYINSTLIEKPGEVDMKAALGNDHSQIRGAEAQFVSDVKENDLGCESRHSKLASATKNSFQEPAQDGNGLFSGEEGPNEDSIIDLKPYKQPIVAYAEEESSANDSSYASNIESRVKFPTEAVLLQGKPERDQPVKEVSDFDVAEKLPQNVRNYGNGVELPSEEQEKIDWARAENLARMEGKAEVELISSSARGFVASFGSLVGYLPYRNLAARWKFLAFESWLKQKGINPARYRQTSGIIGSHDDAANLDSPQQSSLDKKVDPEIKGEVLQEMNLEDLLTSYDQEKLKFLSSFVGQKIKVHVISADRKSRKLIFSTRPKEKQEVIEKKRSLMAKLHIGDVVKCQIKKIAYFGIFVEVEGVPALIHQTEVSWDATLDPASYFRIGQIVEAKVHQLDFALERIFLSLKEITPDPLTEALESVVGDRTILEGRSDVALEDEEWADVELLIKELQQIEGIHSVSKGRFLLSPGLAPTFQVYMAPMFKNQYKLLARSGNKVQEVIVEASLNKEEMKSAILVGTNRVE